MKKGVYLPTNQNIVIIDEFEGYFEILLDGEYKTVVSSDVALLIEEQKLSSFEEFKESIFISCVKNPLSDILYSYNTNRLTPEPHQYKPLIKFLNSDNNRLLIADEVGLGKTIEAGMIYKEISKREEFKISLIVVPSSLTYKWKEEFAIRFDEYFEIYKVNEFLKLIEEMDRFDNSKFFNEKIIISYHTLRDERVMRALKSTPLEVDFLIMDEAHSMRNKKTSTLKSAKLITSMAEHIIFLTATPVQNSLNDLFNILTLLEEDYFKDFSFFEKMIAPNQYIHKLITYLRNNHNLEEIKEFISQSIDEINIKSVVDIFNRISKLEMIDTTQRVRYIDELTKADHLSFIINRSKKKDVGLSTPRNAKSIVVEITPQEQDYYDAVIELVLFIYPHVPQGFITILPERMVSSSMLASLQNFKELKNSGRMLIVDEDSGEEIAYDITKEENIAKKYLDNILAKGELIGSKDSKFIKFQEILEDLESQNIKQKIVFSFFKKTLDYLEDKLIELGYKVGKIHGDFSVEERFDIIKQFRKGLFDILLSSEVGSEGLDMQFCNVIINYDLPWNPMRVEQRIGRIDRIGQKFDKLHIFNLCIAGSIEDRIYNRLYSKLGIFENSIGELEPILGELNESLDIAKLIHLSQKEIDEKLHLEELAQQRKEFESKSKEDIIHKLINEDINYQEQKDSMLSHQKIELLQEQSRSIVVGFLQKENIPYQELKDTTLKLSSESIKKLFNILKAKMSDKTKQPLNYKLEKQLLMKLKRYKELKISFQSNDNEEFQTLYVYLHSPLLHLITKDTSQEMIYTSIIHPRYSKGYAIIYRIDLSHSKQKSMIKVIVLDNEFNLIDELDYFDFIYDCSGGSFDGSFDVDRLKSIARGYIIQRVESYQQDEYLAQKRVIDIKIDSITNYFTKQINRAINQRRKVNQEDIYRMRGSEIENLKYQRDIKIEELQKKKEVKSSFKILGIGRIGV